MEILISLIIAVIGYKIYDEVTCGYCMRKVSKMADNSSADIITLLGPSLKMERVAKFTICDFPYLPEEIVGSDLWEIFVPQVAGKIVSAYREAIKSGSVVSLDLSIDNDNSTTTFEIKYIPLRNGYVACLWHDLSKVSRQLDNTYVQEDTLSVLSVS